MMYEAGANVLWLDPGLSPAFLADRRPWIALEEPSVAVVRRTVNQFFSKDAAWSAKASCKGRLVWPITMEAAGLTRVEYSAEYFDSSIRLLGGHTVLYAWYGAMRDALMARDDDMIRMLWECGLTMTPGQGVQDSNKKAMKQTNNNKPPVPAARSGCVKDCRTLSF